MLKNVNASASLAKLDYLLAELSSLKLDVATLGLVAVMQGMALDVRMAVEAQGLEIAPSLTLEEASGIISGAAKYNDGVHSYNHGIIEAVKSVRTRYGCSLAEAKVLVDAWKDAHGTTVSSGKSPWQGSVWKWDGNYPLVP